MRKTHRAHSYSKASWENAGFISRCSEICILCNPLTRHFRMNGFSSGNKDAHQKITRVFPLLLPWRALMFFFLNVFSWSAPDLKFSGVRGSEAAAPCEAAAPRPSVSSGALFFRTFKIIPKGEKRAAEIISFRCANTVPIEIRLPCGQNVNPLL